MSRLLDGSGGESIEYRNAMLLCKLFPLKPQVIKTDNRTVGDLSIVSTGRIPKELWTKYIIKHCDALALLKLEKASRFFYFHLNACTECDYSPFDAHGLSPEELEVKFIRSFHCKSVWT